MQFVVRQPRARQVDFSRLKYMLTAPRRSGGAAEGMHRDLQMRLCQMYGMTETTGTIVALPPEDHVEGLDRMRSAGKALPGIELAILDADGKRCRRAKSARSPPAPAPTWSATGTCRSHRQNARQRRLAAHRRRRLHGQDGYLYIHDRIKDMIISGGENIYPAEVESAICDHPDVPKPP
jgi:Acyl-CoA synthetases (AMP-forming)/AMP-acid ligases II